MSFKSTYKLIKSLSPLEVFDIITRGVCDDYLPEIKREIIPLRGEWSLNNWSDNKLDILSLYLSDSGFQLYTSRAEAKRLEGIFKSWGLFYEVWSKWYSGDDRYTVGFNYTYDAFEKLYAEWIREKKLEQIGI